MRAILVVDDDAMVLAAVVRLLKPYRPCVTAQSSQAAYAALDAQSFCGLVVDVGLESPRAGLDVLAHFRARQPGVPAMVLTGQLAEDIVAAADEARARLVLKGTSGDKVRSFGLECAGADLGEPEALAEVLGEYGARAGLSPVELATVHGALHGRRATWFKDNEGIALSTYKWRAGSALQKTGHDSLETLTNAIFLDALKRASAPLPI